jgi:hypothetical protein
MKLLKTKSIDKYIIITIFFLIFWITLLGRYSNDYDYLWHIKIGEQITNTGTITTNNTFTWLTNSEWNQQEWLFDVLLYNVVHIFNIYGFYIIHAVFSIILFYVSVRIVKPKNIVLFGGVYLLVHLLLYATPINRPSEYSTFCFIIILYLYNKKIDFRNILFYFLIGVFLSNFHCGQAIVLLGFMCAQFGLDFISALLYKDKEVISIRYIGYRICSILLFSIGLLVNPLGYTPIISMLKAILADNSYISEWQPFQSSFVPQIIGTLFLIIVLFCSKRKYSRKDFINIGLLCILFVLTFKAIKSSTLLVYCYPILGYTYIEQLFDKAPLEYNKRAIHHKWWIIISTSILSTIFCLLSFVYSYSTMDKYVLNTSSEYISSDIVEYLKNNKPSRLLNGYAVGNILLWNDIKVFQDTRQHPYIKEMGYEDSVHIFMQMRKDKDGAIIDHYFKKYDFDAIVTNQELDVTWWLKQRPDYVRIIDGENCDLWIKDK